MLLSAAAVAAIALFDRALRLSLYQSMAATIIALSIVVLTGYLGQVSLAQAVFAGVAGFLLGKLAAETGIPFPLTPLIGALGAMVLGRHHRGARAAHSRHPAGSRDDGARRRRWSVGVLESVVRW